MRPEDFQRLQEAFLTLCDLPPRPRADALRSLALHDPELAQEVAAMLRADAQQEGFLETGAPLLSLVGPEPGAEIADFVILGELGAGGMGRVYEARQRHPDRVVALKTVHPWLRGPKAMEAFRREAEAMSRIQHPGIPHVYAAFEERGEPWLAMERVVGEPLDQAARRLDPRARARLMAQVAQVVGAAHQEGVVHRDLKPANVLVDAQGQPHVLDFGVALLDTEGPGPGGTPTYMAPEQRDQPGDARSDVHALGVILGEVMDPTAPDILAVQARATDPDPDARHPHAQALAEDLWAHLEHRVGSAGPHTLPWRARQLLRRRRAWLLVPIIGLLLAAIPAGRHLQARRLEQRALERWAALHASLEQAPPDSQAALLEAFLADPEIAGSQARVEALLYRAERDPTEQRWAEAFLAAQTPALERRALLGLAELLIQTHKLQAASRLYDTLPDPPTPERFQALTATHRFGPAAQLSTDPHQAALLTGWAAGQLLDFERPLARVDLEGDGLDEVLALEDGGHTLLAWSPQAARRFEMSSPMSDWVIRTAQWQGVPVLGWASETQVPTLSRLTPAGPETLATTTQPLGAVTYMTPLRLSDATVMVLATTQLRLLVALPGDPELHELPTDLPATTRLRGLLAHDLDGDGQDELLVALGDVYGLELRALRWVDGRLESTGLGQPTGPPGSVLGLQTPTGFRAVLPEAMGFWPSELGARPTPSVRLFRVEDGALVPDRQLPFAGPLSYSPEGYQVADIDGDGLEDLLLMGLLYLQDPDGGFERLQVGGGLLAQLDQDPQLELVVNETDRVWVAGLGDGPLLERHSSPALPPLRDPGLDRQARRALLLSSIGLDGLAGRELARLSREGGPEDAERLAIVASELLAEAGAFQEGVEVLAAAPGSQAQRARLALQERLLPLDGPSEELRFTSGLPEGWTVSHPELLSVEDEGLRVHAWSGAGEILAHEVELTGGPIELGWDVREVHRERNATLSWGIELREGWRLSLDTVADPQFMVCFRGAVDQPFGRVLGRADLLAGKAWCDSPLGEQSLRILPSQGTRFRLALSASGPEDFAITEVLIRELRFGGMRLVDPEAPSPPSLAAQLQDAAAHNEPLGPLLSEALESDPESVRLMLRLRPARMLPELRPLVSSQALARHYAAAWAQVLLREEAWELAFGLHELVFEVDDQATAALALARALALAERGEHVLAAREAARAAAVEGPLRFHAHWIAAEQASHFDPELRNTHIAGMKEAAPYPLWAARVLEADAALSDP